MSDSTASQTAHNDAEASQEGTIQFAYELKPPEGPAAPPECTAELSAWRSILHSLKLIGQQPDLYDGFAYGNLSARPQDSFVITASQTSGSPSLEPEHLVRVTHCNLQRFWIEAEGTEPPSSETITHAMIYSADPNIRFVFHIHSSEIWQRREQLGLPATPAEVPYGSPAMADAVNRLLQDNQSRPLVFATAGHEDGIFALAHNARDCGGLLLSYLAKTRTLALL